MRRTQQETFKKYIKKNYPELMPYEPELFVEYFELMLDNKVNNMIDFFAFKYKGGQE